jgi:hypothetical protein
VYGLLSCGADMTGGALAGRDGGKATGRVREVGESESTSESTSENGSACVNASVCGRGLRGESESQKKAEVEHMRRGPRRGWAPGARWLAGGGLRSSSASAYSRADAKRIG